MFLFHPVLNSQNAFIGGKKKNKSPSSNIPNFDIFYLGCKKHITHFMCSGQWVNHLRKKYITRHGLVMIKSSF